MAVVEIFGEEYKVGPIASVKIWLAKHRPKVLKEMRCSAEVHNGPYDATFIERGIIFIGGSCTNCGTYGKFIVSRAWGMRGPFPSQRVQKAS